MKPLWLILIIAGLSACSGKQESSQQTSESVDSIAVPQASVINTPERPIEAVSEPITPSDDKSFSSAQEAYDEGYYNGQQEGYTDATHHLDFGYNYDDEPEYSGFLKAYQEGYEDGYTDGFNEGVEWNYENE